MAEEETTTPGPEPRVGGADSYLLTIINAIAGRLAAGKTTPMDLTTQYISLHKSNPGEEGTTAATSELTGGGYARKQVTWGPATAINSDVTVDKGKVTGNALTFDVPAGTITHYGVWNVATGSGNSTSTGWMYGKPLSAVITLGQAGKVTVTPTHAYGLLD